VRGDDPTPGRDPLLPRRPSGADSADLGMPVGGSPDAAPSDDTPEHQPVIRRKRRRAFVDWAIVIGVALLVAFLVRTFVLAHFVVDGTSMANTLYDDDRVFVNKLSYRLHDPNRGDIVVLHQISGASERDLIKRVIALPGETIEVRSCQVLIDGRLLEEPYLDPEVVQPGNCGGDLAPVPVPEEHVFVMGDNRSGSQDSRALGPIKEDDLVGRAFVVFWPRNHWQWL
jgi:signal peptidase I